jgi:ElaB/YqjD/DUF883 family membrane-anchored ribosome-binding protein
MVMAIAEDMKKLTENIIISNDVRVKAVGELVADTHKTLSGFATDRKKMAAEQAKNLADFVNSLISNVGSMLDSFRKDHAHMSKELRSKLTREIKDIQAEVERILGDADKLMGEFSADMAGAKKAWHSMSAVLARSRKAGFIMPGIDAGEKVTTVKQATRKAQGKKKTSPKSKSSRQKVDVGV